MADHNRYKVMSNLRDQNTNPSQPAIYQIRIKGQLDSQWADWFGGLTITLEEDGDTLLTGPVVDQAALHGLIKKVRDLGMPLVSVNRVQFKEKKMNANKSTTGIDTRVKLSLLWIFVIVNMAYADILSLMDATSAIRTRMVGTPMSPGVLLVGAIVMETAIAMIILSWVLPYHANRWANIIIGAINITGVVTGGHGLYYAFFATVEVVCMLLIIWFAWKWTNPES
jgi:uncharacterized protein DUF6326